MDVRSDRMYRFDVDPVRLWAALERVEDYSRWWPWLRQMDAQGLVAGDRWRCVIRPPVPYELRLTVELTGVEEGHRIDAEVTGELRGEASVVIGSAGSGSTLRLTSTLAPARGPLRAVARMAPWISRLGHDWVLDTGSRQFRRRALGQER
jgi:uncharacterized protein YndB with AHSA1/START domain